MENEYAVPLKDEKFQTALIPCGAAMLKPCKTSSCNVTVVCQISQRAMRVARGSLAYFDRSRQNLHYICRACGPWEVILSI